MKSSREGIMTETVAVTVLRVGWFAAENLTESGRVCHA